MQGDVKLDDDPDFIEWIREVGEVDREIAEANVKGMEQIRARYQQFVDLKEKFQNFYKGRKGGYRISTGYNGASLPVLSKVLLTGNEHQRIKYRRPSKGRTSPL